MRLRRRRRPSGHDMTCREAVALVTAYLDGALGDRDHVRLEQHLDECPHCREHVKQIQATIQVAGEVDEDDLDPRTREELMELFRRWRDDGSPR